jgi:hypothetical protein
LRDGLGAQAGAADAQHDDVVRIPCQVRHDLLRGLDVVASLKAAAEGEETRVC